VTPLIEGIPPLGIKRLKSMGEKYFQKVRALKKELGVNLGK
jgi:hypothetical protein